MHKTRGGIKFVKSDVVSWYTGGAFPNPCSELVCSVRTGHAESMRITFAPSLITYTDLQHIFFTIHDPTTLNRQGNDGGNSTVPPASPPCPHCRLFQGWHLYQHCKTAHQKILLCQIR
jgi:hypothetical protein